MSVSQGANGGAGRPRRRQHAAVPRGQARRQAAAPAAIPDPVAQRPGLLPLRGAGQRGVRGVRPRSTGPAPVRGSTVCSTARTRAWSDLYSGLPAGVTRADGRAPDRASGHRRAAGGQPRRRLRRSGPAVPPRSSSSCATDVALIGSEITHPTAEHRLKAASPTSPSVSPAPGQSAFQRVTGADRPPRRQRQPRTAPTLNQHFAVALDSQLLTVPSIDFHQYPDGIIGGGGADITGGFTAGRPETWPPSCATGRCRWQCALSRDV